MVKKKIEPGALITKPGSTKEIKTGDWREGKRPSIDQDKCVRCGICWTFCPDCAFVKKKDNSKYGWKFEIDYNHCKGCLICAKECPFNAIKIIEEEK